MWKGWSYCETLPRQWGKVWGLCLWGRWSHCKTTPRQRREDIKALSDMNGGGRGTLRRSFSQGKRERERCHKLVDGHCTQRRETDGHT